MDEKLIAYHMKSLQCTRDEAIQLIKDDLDVDKGIAKPWDLTPEQIKNQRKMTNVTTRRTSGTVNRAKKENPDKLRIIQCIENALNTELFNDDSDAVKVTNAERTLDFCLNDVSYSITLTAHRNKK